MLGLQCGARPSVRPSARQSVDGSEGRLRAQGEGTEQQLCPGKSVTPSQAAHATRPTRAARDTERKADLLDKHTTMHTLLAFCSFVNTVLAHAFYLGQVEFCRVVLY